MNVHWMVENQQLQIPAFLVYTQTPLLLRWKSGGESGQTFEDLHERGLVEVGSPKSGRCILSHAYFEHAQK